MYYLSILIILFIPFLILWGIKMFTVKLAGVKDKKIYKWFALSSIISCPVPLVLFYNPFYLKIPLYIMFAAYIIIIFAEYFILKLKAEDKTSLLKLSFIVNSVSFLAALWEGGILSGAFVW